MANDIKLRSVGENQPQSTLATVDFAVRDALTADSTQISELVKNLYTLTVYDLSTGLPVISRAGPLAPTQASSAGDDFTAEFTFRLPPKVHEFTEPFATTIQPTQNGGKFVESQGSILKDIRISGTTGLRPHRNDPRVLNLFGADINLGPAAPLLQSAIGPTPDIVGNAQEAFSGDILNARTVGNKEVIGHDDIIFLRNLFRLYSDLKSSSDVAGQTVMLWRNIKDGDYWIVEPMEFRLSQSAASPLTYEYSISLKTLMPFTFDVTIPDDPMEILNSVRRVFSRVQEYGRNLTNTFLLLSAKIDKFASLPFRMSTLVLEPMLGVINGLTAVANSSRRGIATLQNTTKLLMDNVKEALASMVNAFDPQDPEVRALYRTEVICTRILTEDELKPNLGAVAGESKKDIEDAYKEPRGTGSSPGFPGRGGSSSFLGNQPDANSIAHDKVHTNEDIRGAAKRLLGDKNQFHSLVVLNDLVAPYISENGGPGVLKPGDTILYPKTGTALQAVGTSSLNQTERETDNQDDKEQGQVPQSYGRDLRLTSRSGQVDSTTADISTNQLGDISTIQGIPNVGQAIKLKFSIARGELPDHPYYGVRFPVGTKAKRATIAGFRVEAMTTLLNDHRINGVRTLSVTAFSDVLVLTASLILRDSNETLKTSLPMRTF